jgi:hypothetical protein
MDRMHLLHNLLNEYDVEGLVSAGAPGDEYDSEAELICEAIAKQESAARSGRITRIEAKQIVASVWKQMFDLTDHQMQERNHALSAIADRVLGYD